MKKAVRRTLAAAILVICALTAAAATAHAQTPKQRVLTIFHADSLGAYAGLLKREFEAAHPGVTVETEGTGSLDAIRRVTDLHLPCDIVITADWRLLKTTRAGLEPWVVVFAGNAMGLLYTAQSRRAGEIDSGNWYRELPANGVRYSHSNPERDPTGYWTLIVWQLAERYYHQPGLAQRLADGLPRSLIRPKSIDLISLLQSGELDYYFGYASDTRLGNLNFIALPPEIDLGDFSRAAGYAAASVEVGAGTTKKTIVGAPIAYGATLTSAPPDRADAIEFLELMLGPAGRKAAADSGLRRYDSPRFSDPAGRMPAPLHALARPIEPSRP